MQIKDIKIQRQANLSVFMGKKERQKKKRFQFSFKVFTCQITLHFAPTNFQTEIYISLIFAFLFITFIQFTYFIGGDLL